MIRPSIVIVTLLLTLSTSAMATWVENGNLLQQVTTNTQQNIVTDGNTGGFTTRSVYGFPSVITVNHFDSDGAITWTINVPLYPTANAVWDLKANADGAGGIALSYHSSLGGSHVLIYNRVDADGNLPLGTGVHISGFTSVTYNQMVVDNGFAYFIWQDEGINPADLYAQKTTLDGVVQWNPNGVLLVGDPDSQNNASMIADGSGGLIATWIDGRHGFYDIYAQRIDATGTVAWAVDGEAVCINPALQYPPSIVSDGQGGAIISFIDLRSGDAMYAQRIDANGAMLWTTDGLLIASSTGPMAFNTMGEAANGGAVMFWADTRNGTSDLYGQRIDSSGASIWTLDGQRFTYNPSGVSIRYPVVMPGSYDGFYVSWESNLSGDYNIYTQQIRSWGSPMFSSTVLCAAAQDQTLPMMITDGANGVFVGWKDQRNGQYDLYTQHMSKLGYWGNPVGPINNVKDIPGDQGGFVNLTWFASRLDSFPYNSVTSYTLWRSFEPGKAGTNARILTSPAEYEPGMDSPVYLAGEAGEKVYFWELLETITPFGLPGYGHVLATPYDSTAVYGIPLDYMVITHTAADSVFFMSSPVAGISVDNLAPAAPLGLAGEASYSPGGLNLTWHPNSETDISHYNLYRGSVPDFVPDAGSFVTATADTNVIDAVWATGDYYRLAAVDIHDNESSTTLLEPSSLTDVNDGTPRHLFAINRIAPNPFNPSTEISFAVSSTGPVRLEIYDIVGRRIQTLVNEVREPGSYAVIWHGENDAGKRSASGTYLCRLVTSTGVISKSLVLVK